MAAFVISATSLFGFLCIIAVLQNHLSMEANIYVTVPDMYAVKGQYALIKCIVKFTRLPSPNDTGLRVSFSSADETTKWCAVRDWMDCVSDGHWPKPAKVSCGCLMRSEHRSIYMFYLLLHKVDEHFHNSRFVCTVDAQDQQGVGAGNLKLTDFSRKPPKNMWACEGTNVAFPWEFDPRKWAHYFDVRYIRWMFYPDKGGSPFPIAVHIIGHKWMIENENFRGRASIHKVRYKKTIPRLQLEGVTERDNGRYQIQLHFLTKGDAHFREKRSRLFDESLLDIPQPEEESPWDEQEPQLSNKGDVDKTVPSQTEGELAKLIFRLVSRTPVLSSTVHFRIKKAPSRNLHVQFESIHRSEGLTAHCSMTRNEFRGFPPVYLTLYHMDKVLMRSYGNEVSIHLILSDDASVYGYKCRLSGSAVKCVNKTSTSLALGRQIENLLTASRSTKDVIAEDFDVFHFIYALEGAVCIVLLLWNCSLLLGHVKLLCDRKANEAMRLRQEAVAKARPIEKAPKMSEKRSFGDQKQRRYKNRPV